MKGRVTVNVSLPQLTKPRIEQALIRQDLNFGTDEDGDFVVGFENIVFFITVDEELLRISGWWRGKLETPEQIRTAVECANRVNCEALMPKCVIAGDPQNVIFENSLHTYEGITDAQIDAFIEDTFGFSFSICEKFDEALPDVAAAIPSYDEEGDD